MVGTGSGAATHMSKEAVHMMALHQALRTLCLNSDWTYSVFWTIRPRPRVRGGNGCKVGDDNGSLMLMWEDGFCRDRGAECLDAVRKAFSKMSIQLYNYGEGLMGKVASDKCHKWVFKEPTECVTNNPSQWQSSFDAVPAEWSDQFESGIQTIVVIQAGHGLLQLGSNKIIQEDLHFVLRMRHTFESLVYQSGLYLSQIFSPWRDTSISPVIPFKQSNMLDWAPRTIAQTSKGENHRTLLLNPPPSSGIEKKIGNHEEHDANAEWPNGLNFFNGLDGLTEDANLVFNPEDGLGSQTGPNLDTGDPNEFFSMGRNPKREHKKVETRMAVSSSSAFIDNHAHNLGSYDIEGLLYSDHVMKILK